MHRTSARTIAVGARVTLRVVTCLLVMLLMGGCDDSSGATLETRQVRTWSMPAEGATIPAPRAIAPAWEGEMAVLDTAGRVLIFNLEGELIRKWWMPEYDVGKPEGACLLDDGRLAVADTHYHRVVFFDREGAVVGMIGQYGQDSGQFIYPVKITKDDRGNFFVAEYGSNDRIQKFSARGEWILSFGGFGTEPGEFQRPSGVVWHEGKVYVADATNHRVQAFTDDGGFLGMLNEGEHVVELRFPYDMTLGPQGRLYVVEWGAGRVTAVSPFGWLFGRFGGAGSGEGQLSTPWGLAFTPDGRLWVADTGNRRLMEITF
jgi:sugar lactone lactonase YvrE